MICRVWHGWTRPEDADAYERLLREDVLPGLRDAVGDGWVGADVLRDGGDDEVEFVTLLWLQDMEAVRAFADGDDPARAHVPAAARELLARWDERARHFEVRQRRR